MKVTVVYNRSATANPVTDDSVQTAQAINTALTSLGYDADLFELKDASLPNKLPDVFFNQAWGIGDDENSEDKVVEILESSGIPFTGASATAIRLTGDKAQTKKLLTTAGVPTPKWQTVSQRNFVLNDFSFPVIVKPDGQDCSLGIDQNSIFTSPAGVTDKVAALLKEFSDSVLIEEYVAGREINATVLGDQVLPLSEITFGPSFASQYKIVDYASKWETKSPSFRDTVGVCPADLPAAVTKNIAQLAIKAFELTGGRDFARVDFRLRSDNQPFVLEVNVNPAIGPDDGATRSAHAAGLSYAKFLEKIVQLAYARRRQT